MNHITYRFTLDLAKHGSQTVLSGFKVGDTNRAIDVALSMNGEPYYLGADQAAQLRAKYIGENEVIKQRYACEIKNGRVYCKIEPELLTAPGEIHLDLEVGDLDSDIFSTASFIIFAKGTVSNDEEIPAENYQSVITALANSENALKKSISTAEVDENGNLVITLFDETKLDCGNVIGPQGPKGERGDKGDKGDKGDVDHTALAEVRRYKYDYDGNGVVDTEDAYYLMKHIQKGAETYPIPSWCNADFNGDGVVNEDDAAAMIDATNFPSKYPHLYDTDAKTADYSIVANALKGTAIGEAVSMKDVSPLEHNIGVKLTSDTITDFSSVTLKKYGKNLLDLTSLIGKSVTANGGTLSCGADGGISGSGTVSGYVGFDPFRLYLPKGKYILSASGTFSNISCAIVLNDENGKVLQEAGVVSSGGGFSFNTENYPSFAYITVTIKRNNNVALSGTAYFQIELGTKATEYEPFKEPETYNGTVDGVPSLYPVTTLMTDTAGVIITAEYNKDTNKVIEEINQKLTALSAVLINNA